VKQVENTNNYIHMATLLIKRKGITPFFVPITVFIDGEKKGKVINSSKLSVEVPVGKHELKLQCAWYPFFSSKHNIDVFEDKQNILFKERSDTIKILVACLCVIAIFGLILKWFNSTVGGCLIWGSILGCLLFEIFTAKIFFRIIPTKNK